MNPADVSMVAVSLLSDVLSVSTWRHHTLVALVTHQAWCPDLAELCRCPGRIGVPGHSHLSHAQSWAVDPTRFVHPQTPR